MFYVLRSRIALISGESEVRQAWLRKSEYLCQIGDKDAAVSAFRQTYEKTVGMGHRIDLIFNLIRLGLFFMDHQLINANLSKAKELMEQVGSFCIRAVMISSSLRRDQSGRYRLPTIRRLNESLE